MALAAALAAAARAAAALGSVAAARSVARAVEQRKTLCCYVLLFSHVVGVGPFGR